MIHFTALWQVALAQVALYELLFALSGFVLLAYLRWRRGR